MNRLSAAIAFISATCTNAVFAHPGHNHESRQTSSGSLPPHQVEITEKDGYRHITSNGIPEVPTGKFPNRNNPNSIRPQNYHFKVTLTPKQTGKLQPIGMSNFGVALDGLPYDPAAAEWWNHDPRSGWQKEAFGPGFKTLGIDQNMAHVQPTGAYHFHGLPSFMLAQNPGDSMTLVGYAADGFPIYGKYGYVDAKDASSRVKTLKSSYRLKSGTRPSGPGGKYNGTYTQDFEYILGSGDLDQANCRFGVTPEYPDGTYFYVLTETFPYIPRYWQGTPDSSFAKGGPGGRRGGFGMGRQGPPPGSPPRH